MLSTTNLTAFSRYESHHVQCLGYKNDPVGLNAIFTVVDAFAVDPLRG